MVFRPLIVIKRIPNIDFMALHKLGFALSALLTVASVVLFLTLGPADLAAMRGKLDGLGLGQVSLQGFGSPDDVLIRLPRQPGDDKAQMRGVDAVRQALGATVEFRRVEVVGPKVGSELIAAGVKATVLALLAIAAYVWFRFEWPFGVGAMLSTIHDSVTTVGLFALLQLEFNLTTLAAILTIAGYSIND